MIKHLLHIFTLCCIFVLGIVAGRLFSPKPSKIVATTQVNNVLTQKTEVSTQAEVKKDSTTVKQTIVVRKKYDSKGKVTSETFLAQQLGNDTQENVAIKQMLSQHYIENASITKRTVTTFKPNWEIGGMIRASSLVSPQDYKNFSVDVGYRLFFDVYARVEVKSNFDTSIGFFILL
jgi:hypothetical protein